MVQLTLILHEGFRINEVALKWGMERREVRNLLKNEFKEDDFELDSKSLSETDDFVKKILGYGLADQGIELSELIPNQSQRRDIYQDFNQEPNLFYLEYDANDRLTELKVHHGMNISVNEFSFGFEDDIHEIKKQLEPLSSVITKVCDHQYEYPNLKIVIADGEAMGGMGHQLCYLGYYQ